MKKITSFVILLLLSGCSLLKMQVNTGDTPLSPADLDTRISTRGFYREFIHEVIAAADTIVARSALTSYKLAAVRWKLAATGAAADAAMQSLPEVALLDTWILCRQMDDLFAVLPDSLLFGPESGVARTTAERLDARIAEIAARVLDKERYELMSRFVDGYVERYPAGSTQISAAGRLLAWDDALAKYGLRTERTVGAVSEVVADMGERMSASTQRLSNALEWNKQIFDLQMADDSLREVLQSRIDSLTDGFARLVRLAENSPEMVDSLGRRLTLQLDALADVFDASIDNAFLRIDIQRAALETFVDRQRADLMAEIQQTAESALQATLDGIPRMVRSLLLWIILGLSAILGVPFLLGFLLGRARCRRSAHDAAEHR